MLFEEQVSQLSFVHGQFAHANNEPIHVHVHVCVRLTSLEPSLPPADLFYA